MSGVAHLSARSEEEALGAVRCDRSVRGSCLDGEKGKGDVSHNQSLRSSPQKNRATVPGPVWLPMVVPTL